MTTAIFDSDSFVSELKAKGMPENQARFLSQNHQTLLNDKIVTK